MVDATTIECPRCHDSALKIVKRRDREDVYFCPTCPYGAVGEPLAGNTEKPLAGKRPRAVSERAPGGEDTLLQRECPHSRQREICVICRGQK